MKTELRARIIEGTDVWYDRSLKNNGKYKFFKTDNNLMYIGAPCDQAGYDALYNLGKKLWDMGMCTKFEIAAFDEGELFWFARPDQYNFTGGRFDGWFDGMIAAEAKAYRSESFQSDMSALKYVQDYQKKFWDGRNFIYASANVFESTIRDTQLYNNLERVRGWVNNGDELPKGVGFEHKGTWIVNPFYDETLRFGVEPLSYYGVENVEKFIADVIDKTMDFSLFKEQVRNKGGIWASDDVHFTQCRDGFGASYLPEFPNHSLQDCAVSYNWLTNKWDLVEPKEYDLKYNAVGKKVSLEGQIADADAQKSVPPVEKPVKASRDEKERE